MLSGNSGVFALAECAASGASCVGALESSVITPPFALTVDATAKRFLLLERSSPLFAMCFAYICSASTGPCNNPAKPSSAPQKDNQMTKQAPSTPPPTILVNARNSVILHQSLYAVARLSVADHLQNGCRSASDLARQLNVNEDALYRVLRLLASQGIFEENGDRSFRNTDISNYLRSDVPGSLRALLIFWGSDYSYASLGQMLRTLETGKPAPILLS